MSFLPAPMSKKPKQPFLLIKELLSNALEAVWLRCDAKKDDDKKIEIDISVDFTEDKKYVSQIQISDNGVGFTQKNWNSFCSLGRGFVDKPHFKCKGQGRLLFWHHFDTVSIDSVFSGEDKPHHFKIDCPSKKELLNEDYQINELSSDHTIKTVITLKDASDKALPAKEFETPELKQKIYQSFLASFLNLKKNQYNLAITVNGDLLDIPDLKHEAFGLSVEKINEKGEAVPQSVVNFLADFYFVPATGKNSIVNEHSIQLCVKEIAVEDITNQVFDKSLRRKPSEHGFFIGFIQDSKESVFLENHILADRSAFEMGEDFYKSEESFEKEHGNLLPGEFLIKDHLIEKIEEEMRSKDLFKGIDGIKTKEQIEEELSQKFLITSELRSAVDIDIRIKVGEDPENVVNRFYEQLGKKRASGLINEQKVIASIREVIEENRTTNTKDPYWRNTLKDKMAELAELTNKDNKNLLAQHAYLRIQKEKILEFFINADKQDVKDIAGTKNAMHESLIHSLFFPQSATTQSINEQDNDLWMINEEYLYYDIISDQQLKSYELIEEKTGTKKKLLDSEKFEMLYAKQPALIEYYSERKKPDIAIFTDAGAIVLIELKEPDEELSHATNQIYTYAQIIASAMIKDTSGNLPYNKFYLYVLGGKDLIHTATRARINTPLANGGGFFDAGNDIKDLNNPKTSIADAYIEVSSYEHLLKQVQIRNRRYKELLGHKDDQNSVFYSSDNSK
jgi:hypothetical protein